MDEPSFQLEKLRIEKEADIKKEGFRASVRKVIYGTMIVGVASAAFPFAQKVAEFAFTERIESIRRDKEIEILTEKNRLEEQLANKQHELDFSREKFSQDSIFRKNHREFLQSLAEEGRSKNIEERIILSEFYSFLAEKDLDRQQWKDFRDHLYTKQKELNKEREELLAATTGPETGAAEGAAERIAALTRLEQIQRLENPVKRDVPIDRPPSCDFNITGVLKTVSIKNHRIQEIPFCRSPNQSGDITGPEYVVIGYTAGSSLGKSVVSYQSPQTKQSAHLIIGRDGTAVQLVPFNKKAWHAGRSSWNGRVGLNSYSIGIDLDNAGALDRQGDDWRTWYGSSIPDESVVEAAHKFRSEVRGWHTYTEPQLKTLKTILKVLTEEYGITAEAVIGHDDIAPGRKSDPGPAFPMDEIRDSLK